MASTLMLDEDSPAQNARESEHHIRAHTNAYTVCRTSQGHESRTSIRNESEVQTGRQVLDSDMQLAHLTAASL